MNQLLLFCKRIAYSLGSLAFLFFNSITYSQDLPPAMPTGFHLFPADGKVYLQWNAVDDASVTAYIIHRQDTEYAWWGNTSDRVDTVAISDTTFIDDTVINGNHYTYYLTAYSEAGGNSSPSDGLFVRPRKRNDSFGYTVSTNRDLDGEKPTFYWHDIAQTGTLIPLTGSNQNLGNFPIGFSFPFYNFQFDSFRVATNGIVSFTSDSYYNYPNYELPYNPGYDISNIIAPFWTTLEFSGKNVHYQTFNDTLIIQFINVYQAPSEATAAAAVSYQVVLFKDGKFDILYKEGFEPSSYVELSIGWQNHLMNDGTTISHSLSTDGMFYDGIKFEGLAIRAAYDYNSVSTNVPDLFYSEITESRLRKLAAAPSENKIFKLPVNGYFGEIIVNPVELPIDLSLDLVDNKIYWINSEVDAIQRSELDGTNLESIVRSTDGVNNPAALVVDIHNRKIFWSDGTADEGGYPEANLLLRYDLKSGIADTLFDTGHDFEIRKLALDYENEKIYFSDNSHINGYNICMIDMDGQGFRSFDASGWIYDLAVYPGDNSIYWIGNPEGKYLMRADLDGTNVSTIMPIAGSNIPLSLTLDAYNKDVYYSSFYLGQAIIGDIESSGKISISYPGINVAKITDKTEFNILNTGSIQLRGLDIALPSAPIQLAAASHTGYNELTWVSNPEANIVAYKIFRGTASLPQKELAEVAHSEISTTSFKDFNITHDQNYYYRVAAVDENGFVSGYSVEDAVVAIGAPAIEISKTELFYGHIGYHLTKVDSFKITNTGATDLDLWNIDLLHNDYYDWAAFLDLPETLIAGDSLWVYIRFEPEIGFFTDSIKIISSDYLPETDSLKYVSLSGHGFNPGPIVSDPIVDLIIPEDTADVYVTHFPAHFYHSPGEELTYSVVSTGKFTSYIVINDSMIVTTLPNLNGLDSVIVTATDLYEATVSDTFTITVTEISDPPGEFSLLKPAFGDTLNQEDFSDIAFIWNASVDPDGDALTYALRIANLDFDTTFTGITDTIFNLPLEEFLDYNTAYAWNVTVFDGEFYVMSPDTFGFLTPHPVSIEDDFTGMPTEFKLRNNYPNPFNPSTTIRYDLPTGTDVQLFIYNIAGQIVRKLADGFQTAGFQSAVWDGKDSYGNLVSSGVYLYMVKAGEYTAVKKMTLIK